MALLSGFFLFILYLLHISSAKVCSKDDIKQYSLPCDESTRMRKIVTYLDSNCTLTNVGLIQSPISVPCDCPQGQGLSKANKCTDCTPGMYSVGGEDISDWGSWTKNGTVPPTESGINTYCETYRSYVKPCEHWRASFFNDSLDSGDNSKTRCMSSVLTMRKQFVMTSSYVQFEFRIEGRKCYSTYVGCDGLAFYVDNKVMSFTGTQFVWKTAKYNVTSGVHQLKWVYRKNCFSYPYLGLSDKAFIRSITLVGTLEPQTKCKPCPVGTFSNQIRATKCTKCSYFQYQPKTGQTSCKSCPPDQYSMLGSAYCIPLLNCTKDDLIMAPEKLDTCFLKDNKFYQNINPRYSSVMINGSRRKLCLPTTKLEMKKEIPCRCQPGYQIIKDKANKPKCEQCQKSQHSTDGITCKKCEDGHVTLLGKHYFTWFNNRLPDGFTAQCSGDCSVKSGWIPSGDHIRTSRVVGDVLSYVKTPVYKVTSNIAYINFTCAVVCNISQPNLWIAGNHLADIDQCNLVFKVLMSNGSLIEQINCTKPKGRYVYRHTSKRNGQLVKHSYQLKRGSYQFSWMFSQGDELRSTSAAFEGKLYNISIVGISEGSAFNCTPCAAGSYSISGNTDCSICNNGTFSKQGSKSCTPCPNGTFADAPGSGECLTCGTGTLSLPTKDGCTSNNCQFSPAEDVEYDFSELSRENGPMFEVLAYQPRSHPASSRIFSSRIRQRPTVRTHLRRLSIWPPHRQRYYINLCTVKHENNSCVFRNRATNIQQSLPVMACRTSWWSRTDTSIGKVIGFKPKKDVRSGVNIELLHGDKCYGGRNGQKNYKTTIDLQCDVEAGVGSPGPENNYTQVLRSSCNYFFVWRSLYGCPKCRKQDFEKVSHKCVDGVANLTISRKIPCWGMVDGMEAGITNVSCSVYTTSKLLKVQSAVNKVLIGVGVVIIVVLIVIAGYFFYKHRDIRYKYYSALARNKPMSKLEEEEEDYGQVEGDMFQDSRNLRG